MTHMNLEVREKIEDLLKQGCNFTEISKQTGFYRTTISDEIIKHRIMGKQNTYGIISLVLFVLKSVVNLNIKFVIL